MISEGKITGAGHENVLPQIVASNVKKDYNVPYVLIIDNYN